MIAHLLHDLIRIWFGWVEHWGYLGVFVLMAMESSIIPVPSEIVIGPAAFWAAQGRMNLAGVIAAGAFGSYLGSITCYWFARLLGEPVVDRYGKYLHLSKRNFRMAHNWVEHYGPGGVFAARFLPVVRHLVSIPAGFLRMDFRRFSLATFTGASAWCAILAWFGSQAIGGHPELLDSPEAMATVIRAKLQWFVGAVAVIAVLYFVVALLKSRHSALAAAAAKRGS